MRACRAPPPHHRHPCWVTQNVEQANAMRACRAPPPLPSHHHHHHHHHQRLQTQTPIRAIQSNSGNRRRSLLLLSLPFSTFITSFNFASTRASEEPIYDPTSVPEREASAEISRRVSEAVRLLDVGRELQAKGDFAQALDYFTRVIKDYKDFAFSDYARVGRALVLYEIGDRDESIAEMEDVSVSLKGYPEIHAALAAALYVDKHAPLLAENQFAIATLLDPHYTDLSYVKETKHWPPSLVSSLQNFITLS